MFKNLAIIPSERIVNKIFIIRNKKVMLDRDLAELYGVEARALNQAVKRNIDRFPEDFMFQLTREEVKAARSQFVTLQKGGWGNYAFTELGVAMLSSVLKSKKANNEKITHIPIIEIHVSPLKKATKLNAEINITPCPASNPLYPAKKLNVVAAPAIPMGTRKKG